MKTLNINFNIILALLVLVFFSCQEEEDFERYVPQTISAEDSVVTFSDVETYPYLDVISADTPTVEISGAYSFVLDSIKGPEGSTFQRNKFSIDKASGVISYENEGELSPGEYTLGVGIATASGLLVMKEAVTFTVLEVPISLNIDNASVEVGSLDLGVLATVSYTDNSAGDVTSVKYSLIESVPGFEINESTGEIEKTAASEQISPSFSVKVETNLGIVTFIEVLTVNVGPAPTIDYFQQDGITALTGVTLSPWTAYSTSNPTLDGMDAAGGYEVILPAELSAFSGSFSSDANGSVSIAADAGLPLGVHTIGVIATNASGVSKDFEGVFNLTVETRWDTENPVFTENFDAATSTPTAPEAFNANLTGYALNASVQNMNVFENTSKGVKTVRLNQPGGDVDNPIDAVLELNLTMQSTWKKLRVSFNDGFGFADNRLGWYQRTLASSHSNTGLATGTYDAHWQEIMAFDNAGWSGSSIWSTLTSDADLNPVPFQEVEVTPGESNIYIAWRVVKSGAATGGAQFLIDEIRVEASVPFAAEEE
ncbi:hypothetical protein [Marinoscillum sp. MHG1-6]|uniref:hypothetical protein n=1 Tax=Marinoscillum sp. MHG1-6 TaxID=2959627 RepID=UPI0021573878|nr:hypothetical protein [Marinoscillum sp. MHG1-6]